MRQHCKLNNWTGSGWLLGYRKDPGVSIGVQTLVRRHPADVILLASCMVWWAETQWLQKQHTASAVLGCYGVTWLKLPLHEVSRIGSTRQWHHTRLQHFQEVFVKLYMVIQYSYWSLLQFNVAYRVNRMSRYTRHRNSRVPYSREGFIVAFNDVLTP